MILNYISDIIVIIHLYIFEHFFAFKQYFCGKVFLLMSNKMYLSSSNNMSFYCFMQKNNATWCVSILLDWQYLSWKLKHNFDWSMEITNKLSFPKFYFCWFLMFMAYETSATCCPPFFRSFQPVVHSFSKYKIFTVYIYTIMK